MLKDEVDVAVVVGLHDVEERDDVLVPTHLLQEHHLAEGPLRIRRVLERIKDLLERDDVLGLLVLGAPHDTIGALAQLLDDVIPPSHCEASIERGRASSWSSGDGVSGERRAERPAMAPQRVGQGEGKGYHDDRYRRKRCSSLQPLTASCAAATRPAPAVGGLSAAGGGRPAVLETKEFGLL